MPSVRCGMGSRTSSKEVVVAATGAASDDLSCTVGVFEANVGSHVASPGLPGPDVEVRCQFNRVFRGVREVPRSTFAMLLRRLLPLTEHEMSVILAAAASGARGSNTTSPTGIAARPGVQAYDPAEWDGRGREASEAEPGNGNLSVVDWQLFVDWAFDVTPPTTPTTPPLGTEPAAGKAELEASRASALPHRATSAAEAEAPASMTGRWTSERPPRMQRLITSPANIADAAHAWATAGAAASGSASPASAPAEEPAQQFRRAMSKGASASAGSQSRVVRSGELQRAQAYFRQRVESGQMQMSDRMLQRLTSATSIAGDNFPEAGYASQQEMRNGDLEEPLSPQPLRLSTRVAVAAEEEEVKDVGSARQRVSRRGSKATLQDEVSAQRSVSKAAGIGSRRSSKAAPAAKVFDNAFPASEPVVSVDEPIKDLFFGEEAAPPNAGTLEPGGCCGICFEEDVEVASLCGRSACNARFCTQCTARHAKTLVEGALYATPWLKCPGCSCRVPVRVWRAWVDPAAAKRYLDNASALLAYRCPSCHRSGSLFEPGVSPEARAEASKTVLPRLRNDEARNALHQMWPRFGRAEEYAEVFVSELVDFIRSDLVLADEAEPHSQARHAGRHVGAGANDDGAAGGELHAARDDIEGPDAGRIGADMSASDTLAAGSQIQIQSGVPPPSLSWAMQSGRLLAMVEDPERRCCLQLGLLRAFPKIFTPCCHAKMCFKCKIASWHGGQSCEERQREEMNLDVEFCPACGVPTVKSEGCSHIVCVCGKSWQWRDNPLTNLIESTRTDALEGMLADGFDVNTPDEDSGETLLHMAVASGNRAVVRFLIDRRGDVLATDSGGVSILEAALRRPNRPTTLPVVEALLEARADPNAPTKSGWWGPGHPNSLFVVIGEFWRYGGDEAEGGARAEEEERTRGVPLVKLLISARADVNARDVASKDDDEDEEEEEEDYDEGEEEEEEEDDEDQEEVHAGNSGNRRWVPVDSQDAKNTESNTGEEEEEEEENQDDEAPDQTERPQKGVGPTPLLQALKARLPMIAAAIIEAGGLPPESVDAPDESGNTPLYLSACNRDLGLVQTLLEARAAVNVVGPEGTPPLHAALRNGQPGMMEILLAADADPNLADDEGTSALAIAAETGRHDIATTLLARGAGFEARDRERRTPLFRAAANWSSSGVATLLRWRQMAASSREQQGGLRAVGDGDGSRTDVAFPDGSSSSRQQNPGPTNAPAEEPLDDTADAPGSRKEEEPPSRAKAIAVLLAARADVEARAKDGRTPLLAAVRPPMKNVQASHTIPSPWQLEVLDELIRGRADVNVRAPDGGTPLGIVCRLDMREVPGRLLAARADPDVEDPKDGEYPLARALGKVYDGRCKLTNTVNQGSYNLAIELLTHGASAKTLDKEGRLPVMRFLRPLLEADGSMAYLWSKAREQAVLKVLRLLVERHCDLGEVPRGEVSTPLQIAASEGHWHAVKALLEARAEVDAPDREGATPLTSLCRAIPAMASAAHQHGGEDRGYNPNLPLCCEDGSYTGVPLDFQYGQMVALENFIMDDRVEAAKDLKVKGRVVVLVGTQGTVTTPGRERISVQFDRREDGRTNGLNCLRTEIRRSGPWPALPGTFGRTFAELLAARADVTRTTTDGVTPLDAAAQAGRCAETALLELFRHAPVGVQLAPGQPHWVEVLRGVASRAVDSSRSRALLSRLADTMDPMDIKQATDATAAVERAASES